MIISRIRIRRLVRDLYRAVLGRDPDPGGMQTYQRLIETIGVERAVRRILQAFCASPEYEARTGPLAVAYVNSTMAARGTELVGGRPIAHVASLGSFCLPGNVLRNNGLKRYSLPFDWIFSSPQMLIDCLADDFSAFLDRRYYRSISEGRWAPGAEHELFLEKYGIRSVFAHRDPTREEDYLYLTRCVERFRALLRSGDPKLFLIMGRPNHDLPGGFPRVLEQLSRVTSDFVLIGVDVLDPTGDGQCALTKTDQVGTHALYRYLPASYDEERAYFPDRVDDWNVLRLVYRFRVELSEAPSQAAQLHERRVTTFQTCDTQRPVTEQSGR